jgi:hypothetical protein
VSVFKSAIFNQNGGQITISNVTGVSGLVACVDVYNSAIFNQNGGEIIIKNVIGNDAEEMYGVVLDSNSTFTQTKGSLKLQNISAVKPLDKGLTGLGIFTGSTFDQDEEGSIEVSDVGDNTFGVYVTGTFNVKNLIVSGAEKSDNSFGFVSDSEGGVVNSGSVRVYGTAIKYSTNGISETEPSPPNNNNPNFTVTDGGKYYNTAI